VGELSDMKIFEHIYLLILFGAVLMMLPLFDGSSVLSSLTRRPWNESIVLLLGVIFFFYFGLLLKNFRVVNFRVVNRCIVLTMFFSVAVFFASKMFKIEDVLRFFLVVLLVPYVDYVIRKYGVRLVGCIFVAVILFQSQWGLAQFIFQRDLGLNVLGESRLSSEMRGVAKFDFDSCVNDCGEDAGEKTIRSYGPFQHANVFGGAMAIGLMAVALFVVSARNSFKFVSKDHVVLLSTVLFLFVGLLVSFSRSAYLAAGIMLCVFGVVRLSSNKYEGVKRIIHRYGVYFMFFVIVALLFSPLLIARFTDGEDVAIVERVGGASWAVSLIENNSWWQGVGPGAYKESLKEYLDWQNVTYQPWQIDSVHSVPLLIIVEWGLLLSFILLLLFLTMLKKYYFNKWQWFLLLIPIVLFDHYVVTQIAPMVLVMVWALLLYHFTLSEKVDLKRLQEDLK
jgi:hypothetical protein